MSKRRAFWLRARLSVVWVLLGMLDLLDGRTTRGLVFVLIGVGATCLLGAIQRRSTVGAEDGKLVVRNWPLQPFRLEAADIATVRPGRGVNAVVSEILVRVGGRMRRVSAWGASSADWERVSELVDVARTGGQAVNQAANPAQ